MKILVGCEESQTITKELLMRGHDAMSCDILPTRGDRADKHYKGDVFDIIDSKKWDLIILHPPCTAMSLSGNRWYGNNMPKNSERIKAIKWTKKLWEKAKQNSKRVALENPTSVIFKELDADKVQYIQPWQFGHTETKRTGFALHGLPELKETNNVKEEMDKLPEKEKHKVWYASPGKNRARDRSKTFQGIAEAIAEQWTIEAF